MSEKKRRTRKVGRDGKYDGIIHIRQSAPPSGLREYLASLTTPKERVIDALSKREEWAKDVLRSLGFPTDYYGPYEINVDGWTSRGTLPILFRDRELEPEWHAARVLERVEDTRAALRTRDMHNAVISAMLAEEAYWHLYLSFVEGDIRERQSIHRGRAQGGRASKKLVGVESLIRHMIEADPQISNAKIIEQFHGYTERHCAEPEGGFEVYVDEVYVDGPAVVQIDARGRERRRPLVRAVQDYAADIRKEIRSRPGK